MTGHGRLDSGARLQRKAAHTVLSVAAAPSFRRCYDSDYIANEIRARDIWTGAEDDSSPEPAIERNGRDLHQDDETRSCPSLAGRPLASKTLQQIVQITLQNLLQPRTADDARFTGRREYEPTPILRSDRRTARNGDHHQWQEECSFWLKAQGVMVFYM